MPRAPDPIGRSVPGLVGAPAALDPTMDEADVGRVGDCPHYGHRLLGQLHRDERRLHVDAEGTGAGEGSTGPGRPDQRRRRNDRADPNAAPCSEQLGGEQVGPRQSTHYLAVDGSQFAGDHQVARTQVGIERPGHAGDRDGLIPGQRRRHGGCPLTCPPRAHAGHRHRSADRPGLDAQGAEHQGFAAWRDRRSGRPLVGAGPDLSVGRPLRWAGTGRR